MRNIEIIIKNKGFIVYNGTYIDHRFMYGDKSNKFEVEAKEEGSTPNDPIEIYKYILTSSNEVIDKFYTGLNQVINKAKSDAGVAIIFNESDEGSGKKLSLIDSSDPKITLASVSYSEKEISEYRLPTREPEKEVKVQEEVHIKETPKVEKMVDTKNSALLAELTEDNEFLKQIALTSVKQIEKHIQTTYKYVEKNGYLTESDREGLIEQIRVLLKSIPKE